MVCGGGRCLGGSLLGSWPWLVSPPRVPNSLVEQRRLGSTIYRFDINM